MIYRLEDAAAIACAADIIITRNTDDFKASTLPVMTPEEFLEEPACAGLKIAITPDHHFISNMSTLERALQIAVKAHAGQKDKSGAAYIFHPIRVMMRCVSTEARVVALLHDVVEDTPVTFEELSAEGFSDDVLTALRLLTHAPEVPYEDYISTVMGNRIASEVKIADLEDNMDIRRLQEVDERTGVRLRKYLAAHKLLKTKRDEGIPDGVL